MTNDLYTDDLIGDILAHIARGEININKPASAIISSPGLRHAARRGPGNRFYGFRDFEDGDNPKFIDSAKSAAHEDEDVYIKRTYLRSPITTLKIMLDVGESMSMKSFLAAVCIGCGIASADKMGDRVSFVSYAERPITVLKSRSAKTIRMRAMWAAVEDGAALATTFDWRAGLLAMGRHLKDPLSFLRNLWSAFRQGAMSLLHNSLLKLLQGFAALREKSLYNPWRWMQFRRVLGDGNSDFDKGGGGLALALSSDRTAQRSICLIVSDFIRINRDDVDAMFNSKHDVIAVFVQDKRERELPAAPWPGAHYRLEDCCGQTLSLWVRPDHLPGWINFFYRRVPGWMKFNFRLPRLLVAILQRVFGTATTREQFAANFRRHEEKILAQLEDCGVTAVIARTDQVDEAIQAVLSALANKKR
jgi:hypothetical protein